MRTNKGARNTRTNAAVAPGEPDGMSRLGRDMMACSPLPLVCTEGQAHIVRYVNSAFSRLVGKAANELIGGPFASVVPEGTANECIALLDHVNRSGETGSLADQEHSHAQSHPIYWSYVAWPMLGLDEHTTGVVVQVTDTTEAALFRRRATMLNQELLLSSVRQHELAEAAEGINVRLQVLATTDELTGLINHRAFQERLRQEVERSTRYDMPMSLLFLDIDNFKGYNDTYGHLSGDIVLRKLGELLRAAARTNDLIARYGGEEFAIILTDTDAACAALAAERFRSAIETAEWLERPITASFGAASLSLASRHPADLLDRADKAMYLSKERGGNRVTQSSDDARATTLDDRSAPSPVPETTKTLRQDPVQMALSETSQGGPQQPGNSIGWCWSKLTDLHEEIRDHSARVMETMERLARAVGMSEEVVALAKRGALLHDIGKLGVPDAILHKPGALTSEERLVIQGHPELAADMLSPSAFLSGPALDIPLYHHERWDGSGYPYGLKGEEIPAAARLFAVIDVYDALLSDRPYRKGWSEQAAREHLRAQTGSHFDPWAVEAFIKMLSE